VVAALFKHATIFQQPFEDAVKIWMIINEWLSEDSLLLR
jgi:hypothetical protein